MTDAQSSEQLTIEKIREMFARLPKPEPDSFDALFRPLRPRFAGLDVVERPAPPPKIETSVAFKEAYPQLAAEWDAWLLERFGRREQDTNMYRFSHYLSVPFGVLRDPRGIIGDFSA